jgi:anti-sigma regulatory factor (Ser/Thr protein kinase)
VHNEFSLLLKDFCKAENKGPGNMDAKVLRQDLNGGLEPEKVDEVRRTAESWLLQGGVDISVRAAVVTVLEELCTNIMEHSTASQLEVSLAWFKEGVLIAVQDDGAAFDPLNLIRERDYSKGLANHRSDRSLGLYMVKELTRSLRYFREMEGVNRLVMEVPLRPPKVKSPEA